MIVNPDNNADVDQPPIELLEVDRTQRTVGQGDSVTVRKMRLRVSKNTEGRIYYRVSNHGDITWEDENGDRLDYENIELEAALECAYREKYS